jgi:hypothetical protein
MLKARIGLVILLLLVGSASLGFALRNFGIDGSNAEHTGLLNQTFNGPYHAEKWNDSGEWVFTLFDSNRGLVRLLFYCGFETSSTVSLSNQGFAQNGVPQGFGGIVKQYDHYCAEPSELPFKDGDLIHARGTLIAPSQLGGRFIGDLYVMEILGSP